MRISYILLAAGNSRRFGSNKLLTTVCGRPMYQYALAAALEAASGTIVVVTQYEEIKRYLKKEKKVKTVTNTQSQLGISYSIKLGVWEAGEADGYLFLVCDQPFLQSKTLKRMESVFYSSGKGIVCASSGTETGNPVLFSNKYKEALLALEGDTGGKRVLLQNKQDAAWVEVDKKELLDMDRKEELSFFV